MIQFSKWFDWGILLSPPYLYDCEEDFLVNIFETALSISASEKYVD